MPALKPFEQMHKPLDIEKDAEPKAGFDPSEARAGLCQALESEAGFALLTGPAGVGKLKLVEDLLPHLTCTVCRVTISDEEMTSQDFRQFLAEALGLEANVQSRGAFLLKIRDFLMSEAVKDHRIVLVLESIQCLNKKLFNELELLSDIRIRDRNPITFLFVGLTEAESIFNDPYLAKITNRICAKIRLKDANTGDVSDFNDVRLHIREHLEKAGVFESVFDAAAVRDIYRLSRGRLWAVEGLCDLALLNGTLQGLKKIPASVVGENARLLGLPLKSDDDRESFQRNFDSMWRKLESTLDDIVPPEPGAHVGLEAPHLSNDDWEPGADPTAVDEIADHLDALTQRLKDRDSFQHSRASDQQKLRSDLDNNALPESGVQVEQEGMLPLDTGLEPEASQVEKNQLQDGDWEDRGLTTYIDGTHLKGNPVRQRSEGQWRFSSNDDWEEDSFASKPVLNRSSFIWGALGAISVVLLFFGVWLQFFDESGALSRFFTDTAVKVESALHSVWQGITGDASPETTAPESANPASPGSDNTADAGSLQTGAMVQFEPSSNVIGPEYAKLLDRVAAYMKHHPEQHVSLIGYSDNSGNRDQDLYTSKYLALAVKTYLIGKGVPVERMQILGMGEGIPIGPNDSPEGRLHNRRVEIKLNPLPLQHQPDTTPEDLVKK